MPTEPRDVVLRFLDHGVSDGEWNMDVITECFDENYWSHTWQGDLARTGARQGRFFEGLEHVEQLSRDVVAEGEFVVLRSSSRVRHVAEVMGVPASDRVVTIEHVEMWRVTDGKITDHWGGLGAGAQLWRALTIDA